MNGAAHQRGMAVISALLIATVVAVIAAGMIARQSQLTRILQNHSEHLQATWMARGVQEWAAQQLWQQRQLEPLTRLDQGWAQPLRDLQLAGLSGKFDGAISDEQGKFNLRNLIADGQLDSIEVAAWQRLCQQLEIAPEQSLRITQRVRESYPQVLGQPAANHTQASGFDSGRSTSPTDQPVIVAPLRPMLRRLDDLAGPGISVASLQRLHPFVTILPAATWVNGNTASAEVIAARVPGLSLARAKALVAERDRGQWFINSGDVLNRLRMPQLSTEQLRIGITSDWFLLQGYTRVAQHPLPISALLFRQQTAQPRLIWSRVGA
jgi:general secretion pathway protein K